MSAISKLMIIDEDDEYGLFRYRIACECTDNNCDLEFDMIRDEHGIWALEFNTMREHYGNWWERFKTGIKLLLGYNKFTLHCFMLDDDNVRGMTYILNKYVEQRIKDNKDISQMASIPSNGTLESKLDDLKWLYKLRENRRQKKRNPQSIEKPTEEEQKKIEQEIQDMQDSLFKE